jgi:hypothetical protein
VTNTANYSWPKPDNTMPADLEASVGPTFDAADASLADLEASYQTIWRHSTKPFGGAAAANPVTNGRYYVGGDGSLFAINALPTGWGTLYVDPADYAVAHRTTKFRLRCALLTNTAAPGAAVDILARLDGLQAPTGTAGVITENVTGTSIQVPFSHVIAGSAISPAASADLTLGGPTLFALGFDVSNPYPSGNSAMVLLAELQVRRV